MEQQRPPDAPEHDGPDEGDEQGHGSTADTNADVALGRRDNDEDDDEERERLRREDDASQ